MGKSSPLRSRDSQSPLDRDLISELSLEEPPKSSDLSETGLKQHSQEIFLAERRLEKQEDRAFHLSRRLYQLLSVLLTVAVILILLTVVLDLPLFGQALNPANNEVAARYLHSGLTEGGATNLVADMILDYRAFDTLGESNVLFAASCTVILLLRCFGHSPAVPIPEASPLSEHSPQDPILRASARLLVPAILLFGIYIILNGHLSPGGGFSGGAIMGAGLILHLNAFGPHRASRLSFRFLSIVSAGALLFYALSKAWSFFAGANGLETGLSVGTPGSIFSAGLILPLNIAVGLVVCCTMYTFFSLFQRGDF